MLIIDRIEENCAVCEYGEDKIVILPTAVLPKGAKEGSVIKFILDGEETAKRKAKAKALKNKLFGEE